MPGIRIVCTDPEMRGRTYLVEHPTRKYIVPKLCAECNVSHVKKTYHLKLDGEGAIIVSETVFERLREAGLPKLEPMNTVLNPPSQRVGINADPLRTSDPVVAEVRGGRLAVLLNRAFVPRTPAETRKY